MAADTKDDTGADGGDTSMPIDELARRTGMTVRNIRAHQSRGLVPPPEVRGRTGYYGDEHVSRIELIVLLISIAFVLIAEMINSAIEAAIDVATSSFDPLAKLAKDIAAGAVLIASINAVAVGYLVFSGQVQESGDNLVDRLRDAPAKLTIIALAIVVFLVIATKALTGRGTPLRGGLPSGHAAVAFAAWLRGPRGEIGPDGAWRSMERTASRLGFGPRPTQTVYEYAGALGDLGGGQRSGRVEALVEAEPVAETDHHAAVAGGEVT